MDRRLDKQIWRPPAPCEAEQPVLVPNPADSVKTVPVAVVWWGGKVGITMSDSAILFRPFLATSSQFLASELEDHPISPFPVVFIEFTVLEIRHPKSYHFHVLDSFCTVELTGNKDINIILSDLVCVVDIHTDTRDQRIKRFNDIRYPTFVECR